MGQTTPSLFRRLRVVAFLRGWTVSKALHTVLEEGLPLLEDGISESDRDTIVGVLEGVSDV
jgi:hypothetical protein